MVEGTVHTPDRDVKIFEEATGASRKAAISQLSYNLMIRFAYPVKINWLEGCPICETKNQTIEELSRKIADQKKAILALELAVKKLRKISMRVH